MHVGGNYRLQVCKYDEEGGGQGERISFELLSSAPNAQKGNYSD